MTNFTDSAQSKQIDQREHNNDAAAKRVVARGLNTETGQWENIALPPINEQFDYIGISNTATNQDTLTYKIGGSGGTTVKTLVIGYASGAEKISDSLTSLSFA